MRVAGETRDIRAPKEGRIVGLVVGSGGGGSNPSAEGFILEAPDFEVELERSPLLAEGLDLRR